MTDIFHALILFFQTIYGIILLFLINSFVIWRRFRQKSLKYTRNIFVLWILLLRYILFFPFNDASFSTNEIIFYFLSVALSISSGAFLYSRLLRVCQIENYGYIYFM